MTDTQTTTIPAPALDQFRQKVLDSLLERAAAAHKVLSGGSSSDASDDLASALFKAPEGYEHSEAERSLGAYLAKESFGGNAPQVRRLTQLIGLVVGFFVPTAGLKQGCDYYSSDRLRRLANGAPLTFEKREGLFLFRGARDGDNSSPWIAVPATGGSRVVFSTGDDDDRFRAASPEELREYVEAMSLDDIFKMAGV